MPKHLLYCYAGSKWRLAAEYIRHFPAHRHFVDVFGGTGAVIGRKPPSKYETYNDLDNLVYNVFAVLQDDHQRDRLIRLLRDTPAGRTQYKVCRGILAAPASADAVKRAWAVIVCGCMGFCGHPAIQDSFTRADQHRYRLTKMPAELLRWRNRFRRVSLENRPWQEIIDSYDAADTFFFCDPPYLPEVLHYNVDKYYLHTMSAAEHVELIERLRKIRGYAMLCGYNHPLYTERLFHWKKISFNRRACMSKTKRDKRQENIWLNYEDDGSRVEGNQLRIAARYIDIMGGEQEARTMLERVIRLRQIALTPENKQ